MKAIERHLLRLLIRRELRHERLTELYQTINEEVSRANGKENDYGEKCEFSAQTIARLQSIVEDAERTAKLMKAAEWLYSGDTGENGFAASVTDVRRTAMIRAHAAFASAEAIREGPYK